VSSAALIALARDIDNRCRLSGTFQLRSGQTVTEYFDKYLFESDPRLLRRVAEAMRPLVPPDTELLGGLELGGVPLATMISSVTGIPALFVRKKAKEYGTRRLAEGADVVGRRITLIEDIVTTGGAARDATSALRADGATVSTVVCAIDRSESPGRALTDVGLNTLTVFTRADLDSIRRA
jgi:orotate phosphoribosyltransferase